MKAILSAALFACLSAWAGPAVHPSLPAPGGLDGLGVNIHFTDPRPGELEMLAQAGFRWIRMDFHWEGTERERGVYDFSAFERLLEAIEKHGLRALLILDYSNRLYEKERSVVTAEGRAAYAAWAAAAARRFGGRGVLWEIWNEPNIPGFWKPEPDPSAYASMALAAAKAIRSAAPGEAIIGPGSSTVDLAFLEICCKAGLLEYWDAVSVHPYRQGGPESVIAEYARLRALIARHAPAGRSIPVISGEWGYSAAWREFDPVRQGKMLAREWLVNLSQQIPVSIWYDWHDDGRDPAEPEHHFGTVEHEYHAGANPVYTPKPAYRAARTLTSTLAGSRFAKRIALGDPAHFGLLFAGDGGWTLAAWTTRPGSVEVRIPSRADPLRLVSHTGEELPGVPHKDGFATLTLTDAPQYLSGGGKNQDLAGAPEEVPLNLAVLPPLGGLLELRIENFANAALSGTARLTDVQGVALSRSELPVSLAPSLVESSVHFPVKSPVPGTGWQAGASLQLERGIRVWEAAHRYTAVPLAEVCAGRIWADGDAKVASTQTMEAGSKGLEAPRSGEAEVLKISFRMEPGWKFVQVSPRGAAPVPGRAEAFGCWIFSPQPGGISPRLRVRDATGQVWQPTGRTIDWAGWGWVEFPLDPARCGHWGGKDDGVLHFPLTWDSYILLDNVKRSPVEGVLWVAPPWVIEKVPTPSAP